MDFVRRNAVSTIAERASVSPVPVSSPTESQVPPAPPPTAMPAEPIPAPAEPRWRIATALGIVYLAWGSTYFAIGEAVRTMPPFLMAASRFLVAGALIYAWRRGRGAPRPTRVEWRSATIIGAFLLLGGNGLVSWAQRQVPSSLAALLVSGTPLLMVLLDWWRPKGTRPPGPVFLGIAVGIAGLVILAEPTRIDARAIPLVPTVTLVVASIAWASGSIYSRHALQSRDLFLAAAMQMIGGAACLALVGVVTGEVARVNASAFATPSVVAWGYLTLVGSLLAFSAYVYLLKATKPAVASTYAFVNPAVAVLLGWGLGNEVITGRIVFAGVLLIAGVAVITAFRGKK